MRLILYLYFVCFLSPYMLRALTGPSSGVSLAVIMLTFGSCSVVDCSCVRGGGLVVLKVHCMNRIVSVTRFLIKKYDTILQAASTELLLMMNIYLFET
jgi:hypothetical protein